MYQKKKHSKRGFFVLLTASLFSPVPVAAEGIELKWSGGYLSPNSKAEAKGIRYAGSSLFGISAVAKIVSLELGLGRFFTKRFASEMCCSLVASELLAEGYSAYAEVGFRTPPFVNEKLMVGVVAGNDFYLDFEGLDGKREGVEGGKYLGLDFFYKAQKNGYVKLRYQSYGDDSDFDYQIRLGFGVEWK